MDDLYNSYKEKRRAFEILEERKLRKIQDELEAMVQIIDHPSKNNNAEKNYDKIWPFYRRDQNR